MKNIIWLSLVIATIIGVNINVKAQTVLPPNSVCGYYIPGAYGTLIYTPCPTPTPSPTPTPTPPPTPAPFILGASPYPTPLLTSGQYYIGGMDGNVCVAKTPIFAANTNPPASLQIMFLPTEDLCIPSAHAGTGNIVFAQPAPPYSQVSGGSTCAADGNCSDLEVRIQKTVGASYTITTSNGDGGGYGGPITFKIHTYSASQLAGFQATPVPSSHPIYYGGFIRSAGTEPFGMFSVVQPPLIDVYKAANILGAGLTIGRMDEQTFFDDDTHLIVNGNPGNYSFTKDDQIITWMLANNIVPYIDIDAGPVQYGTAPNQITNPIYQTPSDYATWCSVASNHIHTTFPQLGNTVPAYFGIPMNEPNGGSWDASKSANPILYGSGSDGIALYSKACYAQIKAVFPVSMVYAGEWAMNPTGQTPAADVVGEISREYTGSAACHTGTCWDGISMHISPVGDPIWPMPANNCFENQNGWTFGCIPAVQAVEVANGDAPSHFMITETAIPAIENNNNSAGDVYGQAWWLAEDFAAAQMNPYIDGIFWANIDEDSVYANSVFANGGLMDTSTGWTTQVARPSFYIYCQFAKAGATPCPAPNP
jgi:hypothetical protein